MNYCLNTMSSVPLGFKKVLILVIVTGAASFLILVGSKVNDYLLVKGLRTEAKRLSDQGKYDQAIARLKESNNKWTTDSTRKEIQSEIDEYGKLTISSGYFESGKIEYDAKNYKEAIRHFKNIPRWDPNYKSAQTWILLAEKKLNESNKGSVAGITTQQTAIVPSFVEIPSLSPVTKKADPNKLKALENAATSAGKYKAQADYYQKLLIDTKKLQLECAEENKQDLGSGIILSPSQIDQLINQCESNYQQLISNYQTGYDQAIYQYDEYNRQMNSILSECPECSN